MTKKVGFGPRPAASADAWVNRADQPAGQSSAAAPAALEATRRLTIDIPVGLHIRLKVGCALKGRAIAEEVRDLLERAFPKP